MMLTWKSDFAINPDVYFDSTFIPTGPSEAPTTSHTKLEVPSHAVLPK